MWIKIFNAIIVVAAFILLTWITWIVSSGPCVVYVNVEEEDEEEEDD